MAIDWDNPISWMLFPASNSRLDQGQCGFSFNQARGEKRAPTYTWENLVFGSDMHRIFEDILNMRRLDVDAPIPTNDIVAKHLSPRIASRAGEMAHIADLFVERYRFTENTEGVELKLAFDIYLQPCGYNDAICNACGTVVEDGIPKGGRREDYPPCPVCGSWTHPQPIYRGIIDHFELVELQNKLLLGVVTDQKTQMNLLDAEDLGRHLQLIGYALLVSIHYPNVFGFRIQIYFARYGVTRWWDIGKDHFVRWKKILRLRFKAILGFAERPEALNEATPCSYCPLCEFKPICPAITGWVDELGGAAPEILTEEDAYTVAERWIGLKALLSDYEKTLKERVAAAGPIDLGSAAGLPVVSFRPVEGKEYPVATIYPLLLEAGVDPEEMGTLSATTVKKLLKKIPAEHRDKILLEAHDKLTTRFEAKSVNRLEKAEADEQAKETP